MILSLIQVFHYIGQVAYQLMLHSHNCISDVIHVSLLKKFIRELPSAIQLLPALVEGRVKSTPLHILYSHLNRGALEILVQSGGLPPMEATWDPLNEFCQPFLEFKLEDKFVLEEGSDVVDACLGNYYKSKKNRIKGDQA